MQSRPNPHSVPLLSFPVILTPNLIRGKNLSMPRTRVPLSCHPERRRRIQDLIHSVPLLSFPVILTPN